MTQDDLPPLSEPELYVNGLGEIGTYNPSDYGYGMQATGYYTAEQMQSYARAALTQTAADAQRLRALLGDARDTMCVIDTPYAKDLIRKIDSAMRQGATK